MAKRVCTSCGNPLDRRNTSGVCRTCNPITGAANTKTKAVEPDALDVTTGNDSELYVAKTGVRSLEDLLKACAVDTNEWKVERFVANKWEVGTKHPITGTVLVTPLFQVKAWFVRPVRLERTIKALRESLIADIKAPRPAKVKHTFKDGGYLFEFAPFDLHMGKYAWDEETVTNYDINIAEDLFKAALEFHLERALRLTNGRIDRILFPFGNDVSHIDSPAGTTTGGTAMDVDTRYIKVYRRIVETHRWAFERLREVAPVDGICVPGNHDRITSFHLGEVLSEAFRTDDYVTIDNAPRLRKYYEYGTNLFGFTHGDSEKVTELPLLMARETPEAWARCASREWHIGHKHIAEKHTWREQDLFSDKGVRVRRLMSLSAHDVWHTKHAYTDRRACDAFLFHNEAGFTDHLSFNVDHFSGKPTAPKGL